MKYGNLLSLVSDLPILESALLLSGDVDPGYLRRQISGWVRTGRLVRLRRGLYVLGRPYRRVEPHPFLVANQIRRGSYVSLQSALAHHGMIPEYVPVVTSVWCGRPGEAKNPLGRFLYRHVDRRFLNGYRTEELSLGQTALVASPEKALLDLIHLTPKADDPRYLAGLRLQNLSSLSPTGLRRLAEASGRDKWWRAAETVCGWIEAGMEEVPA